MKQSLLEAIFDANPNLMIVTDGKSIEKANKQALDFTGYSDLSAFKEEHSCLCDYFLEGCEYCLEALNDGENWIEYILKRPEKSHKVGMQKNGNIFYFHLTITPINIESKIKNLVVFNDITLEYKLENRLRESQKMFNSFMNNIPYIVVIKDENLVVKYENSIAKLYREQTSVGHTAEENLGKKLALQIDTLSKKAQTKGKAEAVIEYEFKSKKYIFRTLAFAIPQENEKIYVGMIYIDITKEKHTADELEETKELMIAQSRHAAMGEMISMIAHQWRQPISVIAMDANNVLIDIELDSVENNSLKEDVSDILNQTQHLSKTIDDFRNFFKPHKLKDTVLVSDVFDEALHVIDKSFENNDISFESSYKTDTQIEIFSRELLQVFLNILKNAKEELVQRKEENRKISNRIYENEENIIVEISDNAGGIREDIMAKIFDPYFSTKDAKNGTGLGLYMSKTIVEKHLLGTINARNTQEGALFRITLPKYLERDND